METLQTLFDLSPVATLAIPLVIGLVQVAKTLGMPSKYAPLTAIIAGMVLIALTGETWQASIAQGLLVGLAASGLYSGTKTTKTLVTSGATLPLPSEPEEPPTTDEQ